MSEGGREAVRADDDVVPASEARRLEEKVRELERLLGRKTMEVEILKEALDLARSKKGPCDRPLRCRTLPDEDGRQNTGSRPLEPCRPDQRRLTKTWLSGPAGRHCIDRRHPALRRCAPDLWLPPDRGSHQSGAPIRRSDSHQSKAHLSPDAKERSLSRASHRPPAAPRTQGQGRDAQVRYALVFGWPGVHVLKWRSRPRRVRSRLP